MKSVRLVFVAGLALSAPAIAEEPRRTDFAYAIEMQPEREAPLYRVRLPLDVYRAVTRADLGDLRVFNASEALVPHELWRPPDESRSESHLRELDVFPLVEETPSALAAMRVRIESGEEVASFAVAPGERSRTSEVEAYVLDPGELDDGLRSERLILDWERDDDGFVARVRASWSEDLSAWSVAGSAVVADLGRDGARLVLNEVPLDGPVGRYLKLDTVSGHPPPIRAARLELSAKTERVERAFLSVAEIRRDERGTLLFETPGPLHVETVEIVPSETNTWTAVTLFSRAEPDSPWTERASAPIYDFVVEGERLSSTSLAISGTRDRFWKLEVDVSRGGFGDAMPSIRVGWRPDELVFVARGDAPFELAYGSRRVEPARSQGPSLRQLGTDEEVPFSPSRALALGPPRPVAGAAALAEPLVGDWKQVLLWSTLVLASLVLLLLGRAALARSGKDP